MYNCTKLHTGSAVTRVTKDRAARPHLPSTVENQLGRRRQRRQLLTIGQWNVRALLDREGANRPERRTALVAMELAKYNIDIADGELLLALCSEFELIVTNTMFKQKDERKTTWTHPRSRHWHMIDFIITRCRVKMDIHSTRVMSGANCWTDHQMLRSKVDFSIRQKHNRQGTSKPTKLNTAKLITTSHSDSFEQEMDSALAQWEEKENPIPDEEWAALQQVVYNTTKTYLGKHQDWFEPNDQELQTLMSKRDQAHQRGLQTRSTRSTTAAYKDACRLLQKRTHALMSDWWERKAVELERAADRNDIKGFYSGLKEV